MAETLQREQERDFAWRQLAAVFERPERAVAIHYALQRLQRGNATGSAPVAAIAVRNLGSGHVQVFSIASEAEAAGIDLSSQPPLSRMATLEYALLFKFNAYLEAHPGQIYLHWYMRDARFGFAALEERHRRSLSHVSDILFGPRSAALATPFGFGGATPYPVHIGEGQRVDLALVLKQLYGMGPLRLGDLADANRLSQAEVIDGAREPEMFERGNHVYLERSVAAKARLIGEIGHIAFTGGLVVPRETGARPAERQGRLRVFINYRREDTEAAANWLHEKLSEELGHENVFIDTDDLPAGLDYVDYLRHQIDSCDVFLAMIGRQWAVAADRHGQPRLRAADDFVRMEIKAALARDIPVIPILVEDAPMPSEAQLPDDIAPLRRRQAVPLRSREFKSDAARLVGKIREAARLTRPAPPATRASA